MQVKVNICTSMKQQLDYFGMAVSRSAGERVFMSSISTGIQQKLNHLCTAISEGVGERISHINIGASLN